MWNPIEKLIVNIPFLSFCIAWCDSVCPCFQHPSGGRMRDSQWHATKYPSHVLKFATRIATFGQIPPQISYIFHKTCHVLGNSWQNPHHFCTKNAPNHFPCFSRFELYFSLRFPNYSCHILAKSPPFPLHFHWSAFIPKLPTTIATFSQIPPHFPPRFLMFWARFGRANSTMNMEVPVPLPPENRTENGSDETRVMASKHRIFSRSLARSPPNKVKTWTSYKVARSLARHRLCDGIG